jgi:protein-tyrosine-phosphatase
VTKPHNVLFLCTGNSARSIMAEAALSRWGGDRFRAFSAGSHPTGRVHPMTLQVLHELGRSTDGLRSKSWDEFERPGAPSLHFVFTVCDKAAGEACPFWPGQPISAHWGVEDPAAVAGDEPAQRLAFHRAYTKLERRIKRFVELPLDEIDPVALKKRLDDIGNTRDA